MRSASQLQQIIFLSRAAGFAAVFFCTVPAYAKQLYTVEVVDYPQDPLLSHQSNTSSFWAAFNPTYVPASSDGRQQEGLLVRVQECALPVGECVHCDYSSSPSKLAFSEIARTNPELGNENRAPKLTLSPLTSVGSIAFGAGLGVVAENFGTEDPRIAVGPDGTYHMMYTCVGGQPNASEYFLCQATSKAPASGQWQRLGPVLQPPHREGSKSGAIVVDPTGNGTSYLYWGDSSIRVAVSVPGQGLGEWEFKDRVLLQPRKSGFDSQLVESGPPPLRLSDGNLLFLHNSANTSLAYHPSWCVVNATSDPFSCQQRASAPLMTPTLDWQTGRPPALCNVPNVIFLEAAAPGTPAETDFGRKVLADRVRARAVGIGMGTGIDGGVGADDMLAAGSADVFRVFYGGSDAAVGTALIAVTSQPSGSGARHDPETEPEPTSGGLRGEPNGM